VVCLNYHLLVLDLLSSYDMMQCGVFMCTQKLSP